jgi:hypothetical protein
MKKKRNRNFFESRPGGPGVLGKNLREEEGRRRGGGT